MIKSILKSIFSYGSISITNDVIIFVPLFFKLDPVDSNPIIGCHRLMCLSRITFLSTYLSELPPYLPINYLPI